MLIHGEKYHIWKYLPQCHGQPMPDLWWIYWPACERQRGIADALPMRGCLNMQICVDLFCECGIKMVALMGSRWVCPSCNKAFQSQVPVNKNNGQLRPDQVESVLWFLETLHQEKPADHRRRGL